MLRSRIRLLISVNVDYALCYLDIALRILHTFFSIPNHNNL